MMSEICLISARGFYGDIRLEIAGSKTTSNSTTATNIASNITSATNLTITSGLNLANNNTALQLGTIGNTTVTGSNITSTTGDITITAKNTTTLNASKDTYNESTKTKAWSESLTLASTTAGGSEIDNIINALQISLGLSMSKSKSDTNSTTYNNTTLTAENGNIKINSLATSFDANSTDTNKNNAGTDISGANILANNITINTQGNLTVESLQNQYTQKSKSFGLNLGIGGGAGGGSVKASGNASVGVNYATANTDRLWTDNQTSIIGTNSVTINTKNNTTLTGAVIANILNADDLYASTGKAIGANAIDGNNLTLNTKTLTIANLEDHLYTESQGAGISTSIGWGGGSVKGSANNSNTTNNSNSTNAGAPNTSQGQGTAAENNPNQQNNFYPNGSTTLSLNHGASSKEQTTFATIGNGDIITNTALTFDADGNLLTNTGGIANDQTATANLNRDITKSQIITKDEITGALNVSTTIDNRIFTTSGRADIVDEQTNLGANIATQGRVYGSALKDVRTLAEDNLGVIGTVLTQPVSAVEGTLFAFLEQKDKPGGAQLYFAKYTDEWSLTLANTTDPTVRKNYLGDGMLVEESWLSSRFGSQLQGKEMIVRQNPSHGFLGDLIESGLQKTANEVGIPSVIAINRITLEDTHARRNIVNATNIFYSQGTLSGEGAMMMYVDKYLSASSGNLAENQINNTQKFVALAPATTEESWIANVKSLGLNVENKNKDFNFIYKHDQRDPVQYLTNFSSLTQVGHGIYLVAQDVGNLLTGNFNDLNFDHHNLNNPVYKKHLYNEE